MATCAFNLSVSLDQTVEQVELNLISLHKTTFDYLMKQIHALPYNAYGGVFLYLCLICFVVGWLRG